MEAALQKFVVLQPTVDRIFLFKFCFDFISDSYMSNNFVLEFVAGHGRGEQLISQPRAVSALMQKDCTVQHLACSEAATVIATSRGDVFALYQYQCRRIVSKYVYSFTVLCDCYYLSDYITLHYRVI